MSNSLSEAFDPLNRNISRPNYSQLSIAYQKHYPFDNQIDNDLPYGDIYPSTLVLDSQDRNTEKDEPGNYTIHLNKTFKNVQSIEVTGIKLPNPCYNITNNCNQLSFQENQEQLERGTYYTIEIPPGDYSPSELASTITKLLNQIGENKYHVKLDNTTKKFTIISHNKKNTDIFNLIFTKQTEFMGDHGFIGQPFVSRDCLGKVVKFDIKSQEVGCQRRIYLKRSIGKLMGFKAENLYGGLSYTGQYCFNLNPFSYLALFINDYDRIISPNSKIDGAFCLVPFDDSCCYFDVSTRNVDNIHYIKYFNPPINEISKFNIKFVDPEGNVFDFQGKDTLIVLEIGCCFGQPILRGPKSVM